MRRRPDDLVDQLLGRATAAASSCDSSAADLFAWITTARADPWDTVWGARDLARMGVLADPDSLEAVVALGLLDGVMAYTIQHRLNASAA